MHKSDLAFMNRIISRKLVFAFHFISFSNLFKSLTLSLALSTDLSSIALLAESKSNCAEIFIFFSWMSSRAMKRNVCTSWLILRSAGIILTGLGTILAIFWPQIFARILAGVGQGFEWWWMKFWLTNFVSRNLRSDRIQSRSNNGSHQTCRST